MFDSSSFSAHSAVMRDSVDDVDNSMVTWEAPEEVEDLKPGKKTKDEILV